ncbi:helix-turn-helix transcriptional regulator [Sphingomonas sp. HH69]
MSAVERFSTRLVPPQSRQLFWREVVAEAFPGMTAHAPEGIKAELARWSLGGVGFARARSERAQVSRVVTEGEERHLLLHLLHRGSMTMIHGDRSSMARVGDVVIADDRHPYAIDISQFNDCLILQVPVSMMGDDIAARDWHGCLVPSTNPHVLFLAHVLQGLWSQRDQLTALDDEAGVLLADAARLLCRRSVLDRPAIAMPRSPVDYALEHLGNPDLGTALICEALDLSPRAVQKSFFRHVGLTPTAFITTRRLERAAALLARDDGMTITDVAFDVGFSDSAFFTRCFRRHFGVSPSQWRSGQGGSLLS